MFFDLRARVVFGQWKSDYTHVQQIAQDQHNLKMPLEDSRKTDTGSNDMDPESTVQNGDLLSSFAHAHGVYETVEFDTEFFLAIMYLCGLFWFCCLYRSEHSNHIWVQIKKTQWKQFLEVVLVQFKTNSGVVR